MSHIYTHKTHHGKLARILATDVISLYPVVVAIQQPDGKETLERYASTLKFCIDGEYSDMDLMPYNPWEDVKVDTKVLVRDDVQGVRWYRRYFSHYADGKVYTFCSGCTSWSTVEEDDIGSEPDTVPWMEAKLAEWLNKES